MKEITELSELTEKERCQLRMLRNLRFGELRVLIQNGEPKEIEEEKRSILLE